METLIKLVTKENQVVLDPFCGCGTTLVAAKEAGVDEIYKVGGAQAVAAMAFGTESIPKVDKIIEDKRIAKQP